MIKKVTINDIAPIIKVTDESVDNMGCFFAADLRKMGIEKLYTIEQMEGWHRDTIAYIFENYNVFDAQGKRKQLNDLLNDEVEE